MRSTHGMAEMSLKKAALINAASKYINIFLGVFFSAILARILTPNDYGIVAIVTVFTSFFLVLSNIGFGIAVIQNKDFTRHDVDSLFTITIYVGVVLGGLFALLGAPIDAFFHESVYKGICVLLSFSVFFNTVNAVPEAMLRRNKQFLLIGIRLVVVSSLTYGLTILLALRGAKYYALVFQSIISSVLIFVWNMHSAHIRCVRDVNWKLLSKIRSYSGFQFLFNVSNYFSRNLDKLLIGKVIGNEGLAQYNKAYHFMLYPVQNLTNIITPVLHPIFSDYQNRRDILYEKYLKIVRVLSLTGVLVQTVCFFCAREIILILYGGQWLQAVVCFRYLSMAIWLQMIGGTCGSMFAALSDTKRQFIANCFCIALLIAGLFVSVQSKDVAKIALSVAGILNLHFLINYLFLVKGSMKLPFLIFLGELLPGFALLAMMIPVGILLNHIIHSEVLLVSFLVKGMILSGTYFLLLVMTNQYKHLLPILPARLRRRLDHGHI